ncbi:MAG: helix-turn-helix transcriptional regulator [Bacilli bacterium]|nr:helix-turn-helix transcriptional regulator [Bacilli bacterium]
MKTKPLNKLKAKMIEKGYKPQDLATHLNMSVQTIYRKLNAETEFAVSEALAISELLDIDIKDCFR